MKVGLGLVSFGREDYRARALAAIDKHLADIVGLKAVVRDVAPVAAAKNFALQRMLAAGCDWLFLSEDDVIVQSPKAITGYIEACERSGWDHLMFHAHGPHNPVALRSEGSITLWPNYVGAWCVYRRRALECCGLMDEAFHNSWEHVEHSLRLAAHGHTPPWRGAADATGSEEWLHEIPESIANSSIRHTPEWQERMIAGQEHWRATRPDTFHLVWPSA